MNRKSKKIKRSLINLSKGELKSKLSFLVLHHNPELVVKDKEWEDVYHYYLGYSSCFEEVVNYPFNDNMAQNFIIEETFSHLLSIVDKNFL